MLYTPIVQLNNYIKVLLQYGASEEKIKNHNLDNEPAVAVDECDPEDFGEDLRRGPVRPVPGRIENHAEDIDRPERNQDGGEPSVQKGFQIVRLRLQAGHQSKPGKEEKERRKQESHIIEHGNGALVVDAVGGDLLREMVEHDADA